MAFGPIMRFEVGELSIEMAPLTKESMGAFIDPGMQKYTIIRYLATNRAKVLEDELEWFEKTRKADNSLIWGIWLLEGEERTLIGNSALEDIKIGHFHQATSGSMIFRDDLWDKGIASAAHKARTWYAFHIMGLHRIMSAVLQGNGGSLKALTRSGYTLVYTERNEAFIEGTFRHLDCLENINPRDPFWSQWWHGEEPSAEQLAARERTLAGLKWAEDNVTLL